jgi:hypothetical protein
LKYSTTKLNDFNLKKVEKEQIFYFYLMELCETNGWYWIVALAVTQWCLGGLDAVVPFKV